MSDALFPSPPGRDLFGERSQIVGTARYFDNSGASWGSGEWWQQLQPGSWRGVPFVLDAGETKAGRRVALHEYPYRDDVWPEDLGKLPRRFAIQAYLTGDDVYQVRDAMLRACEQPGPGTLVHPTLGALSVVLLDFSLIDRRERGRYVEVQFVFIVAGDVQFPSTAIASGQAVLNAARYCQPAMRVDLGLAIAAVPAVPAAALAGVAQFTAMARSVVLDAGRILGAVRGLQGFYGRYATGARQTMLPATATVSSCLSDATRARSRVFVAADNVDTTAGQM